MSRKSGNRFSEKGYATTQESRAHPIQPNVLSQVRYAMRRSSQIAFVWCAATLLKFNRVARNRLVVGALVQR